jgi:hypothetical protein
MSNEIAAALIGVGGAVIGSVITYVATVRSVRTAEQLKRSSDLNDQIITMMADFLTEYTAGVMREYPGRIGELEHQLERLFKNLDMHGQHDIACGVQAEGTTYLDALKLCAGGGLSPQELNARRVRTRQNIERLVRKAP